MDDKKLTIFSVPWKVFAHLTSAYQAYSAVSQAHARSRAVYIRTLHLWAYHPDCATLNSIDKLNGRPAYAAYVDLRAAFDSLRRTQHFGCC